MSTFTARYQSPCASPACDRRIEPGDEVVFVDQQLRHDECALDETVQAPTTRQICQRCFTEVSISGGCLC